MSQGRINKEQHMAELKQFTGTVTKTYTFQVDVLAKNKEDATDMLYELDEHDFDETDRRSANSIEFQDGTYVQAFPTGKATINHGLLQAAEREETANA